MQLKRKAVDRLGTIFFSFLYDRLLPLRVIDRVRIELCFQSNSGMRSVKDAVFTLFMEKISGINLNTGAVGGDCHGTPGTGILQNGTGTAKYLEVMVIPFLQVQRQIICMDVLADRFWTAKIHGSSCNTSRFSGGDILRVVGVEEPAGDDQDLIHSLACLFVARQIEIAG